VLLAPWPSRGSNKATKKALSPHALVHTFRVVYMVRISGFHFNKMFSPGIEPHVNTRQKGFDNSGIPINLAESTLKT
jgi:hypothetical protein